MPMIVKDALGTPTSVETLPAKGQAAMAASLPVAIASDQPPLPISAGSAGETPPSLATNASGIIGWLRKLVDILLPMTSVTQTYVSVPAYSASDTTGPGGSNATIVQVLASNSSRKLLKIVNRGLVDAELWYFAGAKPATITPGQGDLVSAGGGGALYDVRVPAGAVFVTASTATALMVLEG